MDRKSKEILERLYAALAVGLSLSPLLIILYVLGIANA